VSGAHEWAITLGFILVATLGKFGGSTIAARVTGLRWREASAIGVLMNTRGLMELIVLNVGMDLGVITPTVFTMLVIMALVTTIGTTPILRWVYPDRERARDLQGDSVPAATG
jgi:Kef-type K+ transport system membrane component KefB